MNLSKVSLLHLMMISVLFLFILFYLNVGSPKLVEDKPAVVEGVWIHFRLYFYSLNLLIA